MTARPVPWAPVVAGAALTAVLLALTGAPAAVRAPFVLAFLALGPGLAFVPLLGLRDPVAEIVVALAVSLALDLAVAAAMLYAGAWSPEATLVGLAALTVAGAALQALIAGRRR